MATNLQYPNYPNFNVPMFPNFFPYTNTPNNTCNQMEVRWTQGENAVKASPVQAGTNVIFFDSEDSYFYIKSVGFNGVPNPIRKFKYEEVIETPNDNLPDAKEVPNYVTKEDFDTAISKLTELISQNRYYGKNRGDKNAKSDIQRNE